MLLKCLFIFVHYFLTSMATSSMQEEANILFREDFSDLEHWETFYFSGKKKATEYTIRSDSNATYLEMISRSAASGIIFRERCKRFH